MFRQSAAKAKRRGTSTPADRTGPRGPSARQRPLDVHRPRQDAAAFAETPRGGRLASSAVAARNLASGRQAVRTPFLRSPASVFLPGQLLGSSPCAKIRLVPRYARLRRRRDEILGGGHGNVGLGSSGRSAGRRTLSRISAPRPDWLAAAWTACIAVGVEDFPPRSLGVYRTCTDVPPGQWDMSGVPEARPRRRRSLDGAPQ